MDSVAANEPVSHARIDARLFAPATALLLLTLALLLYLRTGAPSLLTGDQAEHQFTAYVVGVPHATGYPLWTMLNAVAVRALPVRDAARRVTMAVAVYSAGAVGAAFWAGRALGGSLLVGALAALTLAVTPAFWSLATVAEVYTFYALLILAVLWAALHWWQVEAAEQDLGVNRRGLRHPLAAASLLAGLGATHHGSFVPIVGPALLVTVAVPLLRRLRVASQRRVVLALVGRALAWAALGFSPWLYLAAQYAAFRPFDFYRGAGLPYHPYWGNPGSWGDVLNLALGAGFRLKVFTHGWERLPALLLPYVDALHYQFRWPGLLLGALGAAVLARSRPRAALWTGLVWLSASLFGMNVAADVPKAHVYFLPAYVMWALWIGVGGGALVTLFARPLTLAGRSSRLPAAPIIAGLLLLPLALGAYRYRRMDRSADWTPRRTAERVLQTVEPDAVILCRWEACMALRYLQLVEQVKLGVQLDQTEPEGGSNWAERVPLYAPTHPVYALAPTPELAARYTVVRVEGDLWRVGEEDR